MPWDRPPLLDEGDAVRRRSARVRVLSHFPGQTLEWKIRALQIDNLAFRGR